MLIAVVEMPDAYSEVVLREDLSDWRGWKFPRSHGPDFPGNTSAIRDHGPHAHDLGGAAHAMPMHAQRFVWVTCNPTVSSISIQACG